MRQGIAITVFALGLTQPGLCFAATENLQTAWAGWFNSSVIAGRWQGLSDVQLRSSDDLHSLRNLLIRGGVGYSLTEQLEIATGYAYVSTSTHGRPDLAEHRGWQQVVGRQRIGQTQLAGRMRLEQRFIETAGSGDVYADRLRLMVRQQRSLAADHRGSSPSPAYLVLQNELFLNLSGRGNLNGQSFDQNRAYIGAGYRLSTGIDVEVGYLNQFVAGRQRDTYNHVIQLSLHTRL